MTACARAVFHAAAFLNRQESGPAADVAAGFLSFVVAEEFRSVAYVRRTGRRLANDLFEAAIHDLQQRGVARIKLETARDAIANIFYRNYHMKALGASIHCADDVVYAGEIEEMARRVRTQRGAGMAL